MQVIRTKQFHIEEPTAVAMGKFDSLHLGHKVILDRMKREAECSLRTVVVSFEPGPEVFFGKFRLQGVAATVRRLFLVTFCAKK